MDKTFVQSISDSMTKDDKISLLKDNFNDLEGLDKIMHDKINEVFVKSAAVSAFIYILRSSNDFQRQLNAFFSNFRTTIAAGVNDAFANGLFEQYITSNELLEAIYNQLDQEEKDALRKDWVDARLATFQDTVTEFISHHKTAIEVAVKEKENGN